MHVTAPKRQRERAHETSARVYHLDRYRAAQGWDCAKCGERGQQGVFCRECGAALLQFTCLSCGCRFEKSTAIPRTCAKCGAAHRAPLSRQGGTHRAISMDEPR